MIIIIVANEDRYGFDCCYCCPAVTAIRILTALSNGYRRRCTSLIRENTMNGSVGIDEME
jgi:hypothetical protein